ncbi:unnamed protein product [Adineta ricciae]|uniref:Uncharacterized protein n=1 Tax=Adineta ricciae TaxID=249248 RepID=A0A814DQT5_ADIRI|nr:unnamed protein product [Adineta ricciae]CAF0957014.1 unnamed protein product [Adineta ricciae]
MFYDNDSTDCKFSQCKLYGKFESTTAKILDNHTGSSECRPIEKKEKISPSIRTLNVLEETIRDLDLYEQKLLAFCGLWEDYPDRFYQMEFRIEMGQLVGYSNVNGSKALASFDGTLINMIIIYPQESNRPIDHYRGRLGWSQQYIVWQKEDFSRENGWKSTRRWIRIE